MQLDHETRLSILACQKAVEAIRQEVRTELDAKRKAKERAKNAKARMAQDMAMIAHYRKKGVSEEKIRAFMSAGEDG